MNRKEIVYQINGVAVNWWKRIAGSKTFWVIAAFILTTGDRWNKGQITTADFFQMVQVGVIGILIRAALSRSEMATNAANPDVPDVVADHKSRKLPTEATGVLTCMVVAGALLTLTACSGIKTGHAPKRINPGCDASLIVPAA